MAKGKKITVLGAGNVGATIAYTLTTSGIASEIVIIDINKEKSLGEAIDISQGTVFTPVTSIISGDYEDAKGSDLIIVTVGRPRKPGESRTDLAQGNVNILKDVMDKIIPAAPEAVYLFVNNPVDIITYIAATKYNIPKGKVMGSGTLLDASRLAVAIAQEIGISPKNTNVQVIGEHGATSVCPWSIAKINGAPMDEVYEKLGGKTPLITLEEEMRKAGAKVIGLKGATYYAIALSVVHIATAILRDEKSVLTVSVPMEGQYGINDVAISLPCVVGCNGIEEIITPKLTADEEEKLRASGESLKEVISSLEL